MRLVLGGGGGATSIPCPWNYAKKVSHIPLSTLENSPLIDIPKYPISLEVNINIPEIINAKYEYRYILPSTFFFDHTMDCVL